MYSSSRACKLVEQGEREGVRCRDGLPIGRMRATAANIGAYPFYPTFFKGEETEAMKRITIICPYCGREGMLPKGVNKPPRKAKCPSCLGLFNPTEPQQGGFSAVSVSADRPSDRRGVADQSGEAARKARDFEASGIAKATTDGARRGLERPATTAKRSATAVQDRGDEISEWPKSARWVTSLIDFGFRRSYTLALVKALWACYIALATLILVVCAMSILFPNTTRSLVSELISTFLAPGETPSGPGPVAPGRLGVFVGAAMVIGFLGLNLRVFLEMLSIQFRIAAILQELRLPRNEERRRPGAEPREQ